MRKKLSEITRPEWIAIRWIEDSQMGDEERTFADDGKRTPDEAAQAKNDYDFTYHERFEVYLAEKA